MIKVIGTLRVASVCCALLLAAAVVPQTGRPARAANEIKIVVDGQPITSFDISHRISFLRLQHKKGNLAEMARKQLIDEKIKEVAISRAHASVSTAEVDAAFARFAKTNHMTTDRLTAILDRTGVTATHFKHYIAVQMSWPRVVSSQGGTGGSEDQLVASMLEQGKKKPSTTEYILQQVIFVVPESKRGAILALRKHDAEAMRQRFQGCDTTRDFAAKLHDVAVRDLGRFLQPDLPPEWKSDIEKTPAGKATPVHVTKEGAAFVGVCSAKTVSDDAAAASVFSSEKQTDHASGDNSAGDKLLAELRKRATIVNK